MSGFLGFSHGWTWAFWTLAALWGVSVWELPATVFFIIGGAGVFLGGIVMSRVTCGPAGLRDLGRRLVDPARIGAWWWAVVLLLHPALTVAASGIALTLAVSVEPLDLEAAAARLADPLGRLAMMGFILIIRPVARGDRLARVPARPVPGAVERAHGKPRNRRRVVVLAPAAVRAARLLRRVRARDSDA